MENIIRWYIVNSCMIKHVLQMEGKKDMFYLMMHSTHFTCGYMTSDM